jgi:tripartite-type tricarboxylate transporter receptor subunit TctC
MPNLPHLATVLKGETVPTGNGIFAPPGTSAAAAQELHLAIKHQLEQPALVARLRANGLEPITGTRQQFAEKMRVESAYMKDFLSKVQVDFSS